MNLIINKSLTNEGNAFNEDIFGFNENSAWLLDGSTGLNKIKVTNSDTDAKWFVNKWNSYLKEALLEDGPLLDILKIGIDTIKKEYMKFSGTNSLDKVDYPSSTITIIRKLDNHLEYFILGDSPLIYSYNNELRLIQDSNIERLDDEAKEKILRISMENNLDYLDAKKANEDILIKNRYLKNTNNGYWILEFDKNAIDNGIYNKIELKDKFEFFILSDGFSRYYDTLDLANNYKDFFYKAKKENVNELLEKLRNRELIDLNCNVYPRFKVSDDATLLFGEIK
ncbi:hypothetical protein SAMN02745163_01872 [Clostridium cavendishii DSM 21758]|uniref:Protein phosphatase 2C n=1 Tax=Clostridium cavendishii DSM 21758 TaxID=1121302 RepID=A0A1M6J018_9CLOT|nr:hypothetical protein [Clostridium cavendishii]SHJ40085.1 hypothetical protein SAMN02745163_01872 [Clostridium cavendishii DSM 21758]